MRDFLYSCMAALISFCYDILKRAPLTSWSILRVKKAIF